MIRKGFLAGAAAWLALAGTAAQAQSVHADPGGPACITAPEAEGLMLAVAPAALREVSRFCADSLPATAFLRRSTDLIARYEAAAKGAEPGAEAAIRKLAGPAGGGLFGAGEVLPVMNQILGPMLAEELKIGDCPTYNRVIELLDPLPAQNAATLLVMLAQLGMEGKKDPEFPLCPVSKAQ